MSKSIPSVGEVRRQLLAARNLYLSGSKEDRENALQPLMNILVQGISPDSSVEDRFLFWFAVQKHNLILGLSSALEFSVLIPYDSAILNNDLSEGRWNTYYHRVSNTIEVSTEPITP